MPMGFEWDQYDDEELDNEEDLDDDRPVYDELDEFEDEEVTRILRELDERGY